MATRPKPTLIQLRDAVTVAQAAADTAKTAGAGQRIRALEALAAAQARYIAGFEARYGSPIELPF